MIRQYMTDYREHHDLSILEMAKDCNCSQLLLENIEYGVWITHLNIASRIAKMYKLTVEQYNDIIPEHLHTVEIPPVKPLPTYRDYLNFLKEIRNDGKPKKEED